MADNDDWTKLLHEHPIFSLPKIHGVPNPKSKNALELSTNTLPDFTNLDPQQDGRTPSGRRQAMILKDADLIVAAGKEIRMSCFGDLKLSRTVRNSYKTLHTPSIQFEIHQIVLNPTGKLLAVAGAYQVAVVVLPRAGYGRLVPESIDCKAVQVGQFYHAASNSVPIAKIDWHPWGDAGSTLLVMTIDGKLREYDISADAEEPQQVLTFFPEKKSNSFMAEDNSEREVASFTLGKGRADWGPLTVYAVMKSGDIYSICPYMPTNAAIPPSYIHSLECFISAKQEFLSNGTLPAAKDLSQMYDYQHKYVTALVKQLPPGSIFPVSSKSVLLHPPTTSRSLPLRQGPFLLQPSPRILDGSEGGDATDIIYLSFEIDGTNSDDDVKDTEHLGVVIVAYQDGKADLLLDVEKVEARWDKHSSGRELPMLAVYETIDLGLVKTLGQIEIQGAKGALLDLLHANYPVFLPDPLHNERVYVYHAFGVHALDISPVIKNLAAALWEDTEDESLLKNGLEKGAMTNVQPILNTFSVERQCSNPIIAVAIPNDVYLTYSISILTSAMRISTFPLNIRSQPSNTNDPILKDDQLAPMNKSKWLTSLNGPPSYITILGKEAYEPLSITVEPSGLPVNPKLSLPPLPTGAKEFMLTPDTLRFIGKTVAQIGEQVTEIHLAYRQAMSRVALQRQELLRQSEICKEIENRVETLKGPSLTGSGARISKIQEEQKSLLTRFDRVLQALMKRASPELSEQETKWFEELKRMKQDILGRGRYDEEALVARTRMLEKEYARILPSLQNLVEKEKQRGKQQAENVQNLGFSQAFEYGERSNLERTRIGVMESQITKLATQLDLTLGKPPSL